ncbi:MAG: phosphatidylserine decarboxylase, partial [Candidatus Thiodiazotropha sp.]
NMVSGDFKAGIRVGMDGANYCNWNILDLLSYGYFLVDRQLTTDPRGQLQFMSPKFGAWLRNVAEYWGQYLETKPSAANIPEFTSDPNFGDWYCPPKGGYTTFQEFFTRELCPTQFPSGSRPVHGYDDPNTVVSIGDSISAGWWPISTDGKLVTTYDSVSQVGVPIKGKLYNDVHDFIMGGEDEKVLEEFGSIDPDIFNGGTWTHQFLNVNNYHRLHVPVAGEIIYLKHIQSGVRLKSAWVQAQDPADISYYDPQDTPDWQFGQTRMVIGIKTRDSGIVIISPMGMAQVSSIEKRKWVVKGAKAQKGWEFANFAFGGSDFVIIFQPEAKFVLTAPTVDHVPPGDGVNYALSLQGTKYGCFGGNPDCRTIGDDFTICDESLMTASRVLPLAATHLPPPFRGLSLGGLVSHRPRLSGGPYSSIRTARHPCETSKPDTEPGSKSPDSYASPFSCSDKFAPCPSRLKVS